ncbi:MAG: hypothetical protein J5982_01375 [Bacilli bacterium]|nr:hypothetical protein [Bacilli bacterium]
MYDYKLEKNEEVEIISDASLLKKGDNVSEVSVVITNKRFIILELPTDLEGFRMGRAINYPIKKEVIFETSIESIISVENQGDFAKYLLNSTNYFYLKDEKIYAYIVEYLKSSINN